MKYTIEGFSQEYALTLEKNVVRKVKNKETLVLIKIDCIDLIILRWFVDFYPRMMKVEIEGKQYAWISYKDLLEDLPLLDMKKQMLYTRLQKWVEFDVLTHKTIKKGGTFSYYGFGKNYSKLIEKNINSAENINERVLNKIDTGAENINEGVLNKIDTGAENINEQIDYSTNNPSITTDPSTKDINAEFEELWKIYPNKKGKSQALKVYLKERKKENIFEKVKQGIENYIKEIEVKKIEQQYIKYGSTWFNNKCWEDEYITTGGRTNAGNTRINPYENLEIEGVDYI